MIAKLDEAQACMSFALRKAARNVTRAYDAALRGTGLRSTQFTLLVVVDGFGPISTGALARIVVLERTTLTRNIALLRRKGYLRARAGSDRRSRLVSITARGRKAALEALPAWRRVQLQLHRTLGNRRFGELTRRLGELTNV